MRLGAARWTRRSRPSDPARWRSRSAHAEQRAAGDDPPDHRGAPGSLIYTDEYDIYARLTAWGYGHKTVCHARGEYARDDDSDGLCEVHVNTMEGGCCAPGSALIAASPKRSSPVYLGFFQFVHNARRRGKALLGALVTALVT